MDNGELGQDDVWFLWCNRIECLHVTPDNFVCVVLRPRLSTVPSISQSQVSAQNE